MAKQETVTKLREVIEALGSMDRRSILRSEDRPLEIIQDIIRRSDFAVEQAANVSEPVVSGLVGVLSKVRARLESLGRKSAQEFEQIKPELIRDLEIQQQETEALWHHFIVAAIERSGLLGVDRLQPDVERKIGELTALTISTDATVKALSENAIEMVKSEARSIVESAAKQAQEIEEKARQTARKVSVAEAQEQFKDAQKDFQFKVWAWGISSLLLLGAFVGFAIHYSNTPPPPELQWHVIYYTAIRITILTAFGAGATFALRIFRAHLYMNQLNLHRQRVANSMGAFVESATTPEQRDLILAKMIESVIAFGDSGLVSKDGDTVTAPTVAIDALAKTFNKGG